MSRFRVLQFNMQFAQVWDEANPDRAPVRIDAAIHEIRRHEADIILLQEVEQAQRGGVQIDPPHHYTRLQQELAGYDSCFGYPRADPRELPFGIGLAIFSRGQIEAVRRIDLPSPAIEFEFEGRKTTPTDRLLLTARTTIQGRQIQLLNTHLLAFFMLGSSSEENPAQRQLVAQQLAATRGPALLAGDFNVRRHDSLIAQFGAEGFKTVQACAVTWRRQPFVLDHIFYNGGLRCVSHRVEPTLASDHHVLVADFEFAE